MDKKPADVIFSPAVRKIQQQLGSNDFINRLEDRDHWQAPPANWAGPIFNTAAARKDLSGLKIKQPCYFQTLKATGSTSPLAI